MEQFLIDLKRFLQNLEKFLLDFVPDPEITPEERPMNAPDAPVAPKKATPSDLLYEAAFSALGQDISPSDTAPDERGCAESISKVIQKVYPAFPTHISTIALKKELDKSPNFREVDKPTYGCVAVFPTRGTRIGHTGIWGKKGWVMSNTSGDGIWRANYTSFGWYDAAKSRGLSNYFYQPL